MNFSTKIKNYNKGFYIHYKFEGDSKTLNEIKKNILIDNSVLRHLTVKYKKLDIEKEYFKKDLRKMKRKNKKFNKRSQNPLNKLSLFQRMKQDYQENVHFQ